MRFIFLVLAVSLSQSSVAKRLDLRFKESYEDVVRNDIINSSYIRSLTPDESPDSYNSPMCLDSKKIIDNSKIDLLGEGKIGAAYAFCFPTTEKSCKNLDDFAVAKVMPFTKADTVSQNGAAAREIAISRALTEIASISPFFTRYYGSVSCSDCHRYLSTSAKRSAKDELVLTLEQKLSYLEKYQSKFYQEVRPLIDKKFPFYKIEDEMKKLNLSFPNIKVKVPCLIQFARLSTGTLNEWMMVRHSLQEWKNVILQILLGLDAAYAVRHFHHHDLHTGNVYVNDIENFGTWKITTSNASEYAVAMQKNWVNIADFDASEIDNPEYFSGANHERVFFDFITLVGSIYNHVQAIFDIDEDLSKELHFDVYNGFLKPMLDWVKENKNSQKVTIATLIDNFFGDFKWNDRDVFSQSFSAFDKAQLIPVQLQIAKPAFITFDYDVEKLVKSWVDGDLKD